MTTKKFTLNGKIVTVSAKLKECGIIAPFDANEKNPLYRNSYKVTVKTDSGKTDFNFYGSNHDYTSGKFELNEDDLNGTFECFLSDAASGDTDFEDFCSEFGYDTDSRSAHKIWKACKKQFEKFNKLGIGDIYEVSDEFRELEEAE